MARSLIWFSKKDFQKNLKQKNRKKLSKNHKILVQKGKNTTKSDQTRPKHDQNTRPDHDHDQYDQFG